MPRMMTAKERKAKEECKLLGIHANEQNGYPATSRNTHGLCATWVDYGEHMALPADMFPQLLCDIMTSGFGIVISASF